MIEPGAALADRRRRLAGSADAVGLGAPRVAADRARRSGGDRRDHRLRGLLGDCVGVRTRSLPWLAQAGDPRRCCCSCRRWPGLRRRRRRGRPRRSCPIGRLPRRDRRTGAPQAGYALAVAARRSRGSSASPLRPSRPSGGSAPRASRARLRSTEARAVIGATQRPVQLRAGVPAHASDHGRRRLAVTAAQVARKLGVSTQAASEMFRRLARDGLVALPRAASCSSPSRAAPRRTASSAATPCASGC